MTHRGLDAVVLLAGVVGQGPVQGEFEVLGGRVPGAAGGRAEGGVCGRWEVDVEQESAVCVRIVRGDHVDGQPVAEAAAQLLGGPGGAGGAADGHQAAARGVGGQGPGVGGAREFDPGEWPGEGDFQGVVAGGHAGVGPSVRGRRVRMWAACRSGVKTCQPVAVRSGRVVAWLGQSWARQRCCSPAGARVRS